MKIKLLKKPNSCFVRFMCHICLDTFKGREYVYETTDGELVCYECAKDTEKKIRECINEKIAYLEKSKKYYLNNSN